MMWLRVHAPRLVAYLLLGLSMSLAMNVRAQDAANRIHGADGVFVSSDVAIVWAVLKAPSSDKASVWFRVVNTAKKFAYVSVDGVDPFTKERKRVERGVALGADGRTQSDRDTFSDLPSREIHLYRTDADWRADKPALTIYYLGVPDTTPEFSTVDAMDRYFATVKLVAHTAGGSRLKPH